MPIYSVSCSNDTTAGGLHLLTSTRSNSCSVFSRGLRVSFDKIEDSFDSFLELDPFILLHLRRLALYDR